MLYFSSDGARVLPLDFSGFAQEFLRRNRDYRQQYAALGAWSAIGVAFAAPAGIASYHAVHVIAAATMTRSAWQMVVTLLGAVIIAVTSWMQWSRARP